MRYAADSRGVNRDLGSLSVAETNPHRDVVTGARARPGIHAPMGT